MPLFIPHATEAEREKFAEIIRVVEAHRAEIIKEGTPEAQAQLVLKIANAVGIRITKDQAKIALTESAEQIEKMAAQHNLELHRDVRMMLHMAAVVGFIGAVAYAPGAVAGFTALNVLRTIVSTITHRMTPRWTNLAIYMSMELLKSTLLPTETIGENASYALELLTVNGIFREQFNLLSHEFGLNLPASVAAHTVLSAGPAATLGFVADTVRMVRDPEFFEIASHLLVLDPSDDSAEAEEVDEYPGLFDGAFTGLYDRFRKYFSGAAAPAPVVVQIPATAGVAETAEATVAAVAEPVEKLARAATP